MECPHLYLNTNNINELYDKAEPFSLNVNDTLMIKENNTNLFNDILKDNKFLKINEEINDKEFNFINYWKIIEEEEGQKNINNTNDFLLKSEKEKLLNSKKIFFDDSTKINEDSLKRQLHLKQNRESARDGRLRKKEYIQNLIKENNILKKKFKILLDIIHKCPKCKNEFYSKKENNSNIIQTNETEDDNGLLDDNESKIPNKKKVLFLTAITIISIINLFNIPLNIKNPNNKINFLRNLKNNFKMNYTIEEKYNKDQTLLINKLSTNNGDNEALYIHLSEFYSITKREKIINQNELEKDLNTSIKVFHENQINIDQISQKKAKECVKCVVEIEKNSIKLGGDEFTFYLANRHLSKFFGNNSEDGIFPKINFDENNRNHESFSKFFALKCKILAYSINNFYSEKI